MTRVEAAQRVARIERVCHDDISARIQERRLWEQVLIQAANGEDVQSLAQTVLATRNYVFEERA